MGRHDEQSDLHAAIAEAVHLSPYDAGWPARFERERERLLRAFPAELIAVEHIGSTSVSGLEAKAVIDLLAAVPSMALADALLPALCDAGYHTSAEHNAALVTRRWLMRHSRGRRTHHLHLVVAGSPEWSDPIRFRDRMRAEPALAATYAELKRTWAAQWSADREAYTRSKGQFVERVLRGG